MSAQLIFTEDSRVRTLECTHAFEGAARFLLEHPNAVILLESAPERIEQALSLRLVSDVNPAALLPSGGAASLLQASTSRTPTVTVAANLHLWHWSYYANN